MKTKLLIAIFLGCSQLVLAQPGYMGKRFSVGYYLEFFPHANFTGENSPKKESGFEIEPEHHLNATWVVNRRWELVVDVSRRNREYTIVRYPFQIDLESPYSWETQASFVFNEKYQMVQETYWMLGIRKYFWNQIAPVGLYHQFAYLSGKARYKSEQMDLTASYYRNNGTVFVPVAMSVSTKQIESKISYFSYGIGMKRPIAKSLYGSIEANVQVPLSSASGSGDRNARTNITEYLSSSLRTGVVTHNFIDIRLGLGWMF